MTAHAFQMENAKWVFPTLETPSLLILAYSGKIPFVRNLLIKYCNRLIKEILASLQEIGKLIPHLDRDEILSALNDTRKHIPKYELLYSVISELVPFIPEFSETAKLINKCLKEAKAIESTLEIELEPEFKEHLMNLMKEREKGTLKTYSHKEVFGK